jgi:hypothetical protein
MQKNKNKGLKKIFEKVRKLNKVKAAKIIDKQLKNSK